MYVFEIKYCCLKLLTLKTILRSNIFIKMNVFRPDIFVFLHKIKSENVNR